MAEGSRNSPEYTASDLDNTAENDIDRQLNFAFQHPSWISSESQIRLLRLANRSGINSAIPCEADLELRDVSDLPNTEYAALSYCWGEARSEEDVRWIVVHSQRFAVRTNLFDFLQSNIASALRIPIYIDAICLNQRDAEERSNQVRLMSEVYRNASKTIVWLGVCPNNQTSNLKSLQHRLADPTLRYGHWDTASLVGLSFLCSRVYWRRLWVVQELLLSIVVDVHCGDFMFELSALVELASLQRSQQFVTEFQDAGWWDHWNIARPKNYVEQSAHEGEIRDGWQWAVRLINNRSQWLARNARGIDARSYPPGLPFHEALISFQHQQCSDRRDKVYALLGLLNKEGRSMMIPDYNCTRHELFTQAVIACLVSRWRSVDASARSESQTYEDRRDCEILCSMLAVQDLDIGTELARAAQVARSYMVESNAVSAIVATGQPNHQRNEADEESSRRLPQPIPNRATEAEVGNGLYLFDEVYHLFKDELSNAEIQQYASTDKKALDLSLATIQKRQRSMGAMRDMSRLRVFLQATSTYEALANSCLGMKDVVAYIWAATKFLIEVTHTSSDAFDALLKTYQKLGESMPASTYVEALSDNESEQRDFVALLFHRLFGFHKLALQFFKKPAWMQLFNATWTHLEMQLGSFITALGEYKVLVQDRANAMELDEYRQQRLQTNTQLSQLQEQTNRARLRAEEAFEQLSADEVIRRRGHVVNWLSAPDALSDQDHGRAAREYCPLSGTWLLKDSRYCRWNDPQSGEAPLLWINAIPGAGKSVLASLVVDESLRRPNVTTIYFYFKHENSEKNTFLAMARSLLKQLSQEDHTLLLYLFDIATTRGENVLRTTKLAKEVLLNCLNATGKVCTVIDGIDECDPKEQKHIANFWIKHVEGSGSASNSCRCIVFSQDDASTRELFTTLPAIRICGEAHKADIQSLCMVWGEKLCHKFNLSRQEMGSIVTSTASRAGSMFLFAHLVMDNLHEQVNRGDLFSELENFPVELDDAYTRVAERVLVRATLPLQRTAHRLLSWVACAIRPLKWREIQLAVSIDNENEVVDLETHRLRVNLKRLCGALLQELPNGDIEFVHQSAQQFLFTKGYVDPGLAHCKMTQLCLNYFALPSLSVQCSDVQLHDYAKAGTYGFLDYAMACWISHLEYALDGARVSEGLEEALEDFYEHHWMKPRNRKRPTQRIGKVCDNITKLELRAKVEETMSSMHYLMTTNSSDLQAVENLDLFKALTRIRTVLESVSADTQVKEHYGSALFKCPRIYCKWFHEGFIQADQRKSHVEKHERAHLCPHSSCIHATFGFPTAKELAHHAEKKHEQVVTEEVFPAEQIEVPDQSKSPLEEMSTDSRLPETLPEPLKDAPLSHSETERPERTGEASRTVEPVVQRERPDTERKVKENPKCSICSKVFARSYNLHLHLRTHNNDKPFSCPICRKSFSRQHDRDRHKKLHGREYFVFKEPLNDGRRSSAGSTRRISRHD